MKYYVFIDEYGNETYQTHQYEVSHPNMYEITEEDYNKKVEEFIAIAEMELQELEKTKDDRIAQLEAENAALLYQVLTGEEFTDV